MTTWLNKQKKAELIALADEAGLRGLSNSNKSDIVDALEKQLRAMTATLSKKTAFEPFYNTARANSPIKREPSAAAAASSSLTGTADVSEPAVDVKKAPRRRQTNVTSSSAAASASSPSGDARAALPASTPASVQRVAQLIPLPSSPQAVTDLVERQSAAVSRFTNKLIDSSGAGDWLDAARDSLSSTHGVTALFVLLEAVALQRVTLPWRRAFELSLPFLGVLRVPSPLEISFPDFFVLLTAPFWGPTLTWLAASLVFPLAVGWFFNLSRAAAAPLGRRAVSRQSPIDAVAFNVARGLAAWFVLAQGWTAFGLFSRHSITVVDAALWGGHRAVMVTSAVATLTGIYEAILRRS